MRKLLEFKNIDIIIDGKKLLNNLSFVIEKGQHVCVLGTSASGKTILLKSLIDNNLATNFYKKELVKISIISDLDLPKNKTVKELLKLKNDELKSFITIFDLNSFIDKLIKDLKTSEKVILKIISELMKNPQIIALDNYFCYLKKEIKEKFLKYLDKNDITLLLMSSDIEDTLYFDYLYILNAGKIIFDGNKENVYKEEKLLKKVGFGLPFIVDLSTQLIYYGLVDKIYYTQEELGDTLWKN